MKVVFVTIILLVITIPVSAIDVVCSLPDFMPIVKAIGKDEVNVTSIMPPGTDPHSFTVTKSTMDNIKNSDLILLANSKLLHFEEKIKENYKYKCLDFGDYEKYGASLDSFPKYNKNPHGYWLKLENGIAIAKAVKDALSSISPQNKDFFGRNLELFIREVENSKNVTREIVEEEGLENKSCVAIVPGVCYIIQNMGVDVGDVLLGEELGFASGKEIAKVEEKLKSSEYCCIVLPEFMKNSKAGEIARQMSEDTGKPVVYVKFIMASKDDSYTALHYKNLIRFADFGGVEEDNQLCYDVLIFSLVLLIVFPILLLKIRGGI